MLNTEKKALPTDARICRGVIVKMIDCLVQDLFR